MGCGASANKGDTYKNADPAKPAASAAGNSKSPAQRADTKPLQKLEGGVRLTFNECQARHQQAGLTWGPVDDLRFNRIAGQDKKVSEDEAKYIATAPRSWKEAKVRKPGKKNVRHSLVSEVAPESGKLSVCGVDPDAEAKAAAVLQKRFRGMQGRQEVQKMRSWEIYQAIEYKIEQNNTGMRSFLIRLAELLPEEGGGGGDLAAMKRTPTVAAEMKVPDSYTGPHLGNVITIDAVMAVLKFFIQQQNDKKLPRLHLRYVVQILQTYMDFVKKQPAVVYVSTAVSRVFTVIGDLHGQLRDLQEIFNSYGAPSSENPYLFNGDLVDRGEQSFEVALVIFGLAAADPQSVRINRGNHEDMNICQSYGFVDEINQKYGGDSKKRKSTVKKDGSDDSNGSKLLCKMFDEVFSYLPLAHIIDEDVLVLHGGISDQMTIDKINKIDRGSFHTIGVIKNKPSEASTMIEAIVWSDPGDKAFIGCKANTDRGAGVRWGKDVTEKFFNKEKLSLMVRSHECENHGFKTHHDGKVLTLFSASHYYGPGSNLAAYLVLHRDRGCFLQQYETTDVSQENLKFSHKVGAMEVSAIIQLKHVLISKKTELTAEFKKVDQGSGKISKRQWAVIVEQVTDLKIPWSTMVSQLAQLENDHVLWKTCLKKDDKLMTDHNSVGLYQNQAQLELIFRRLDTDGSGLVSIPELQEVAKVLNAMKTTGESKQKAEFTEDDLKKVLGEMDTDGDAQISFSEFLAAMQKNELA